MSELRTEILFFCWESRSSFGKPVVSNATCCRTVNDPLSWRTALTRPKCLHCSHKNVKLFEILSSTYSWPACVKPDKPECLPAASFNWTSIEINSVICLSVADQGSCNASPTWRRVSAQAQQQDSLLRVGREIFSSFISSTPLQQPDSWQGWDVIVWRTGCKSRKVFFSSSVENDGVGFASSWSKSAQCQLKCKLDCNSRTVMPKIILWSPTVVTTLSYPLCCTHCKRGEKLHLLALHLVAITKNIAPWGKDCRWCAPCNMGDGACAGWRDPSSRWGDEIQFRPNLILDWSSWWSRS